MCQRVSPMRLTCDNCNSPKNTKLPCKKMATPLGFEPRHANIIDF